MPSSLRSCALAMVLLALMGLPRAAHAQSGEVLTNESVIQMVLAKVPKALLVTKIQSTPSRFEITPDSLILLHQSKVPVDVVKSMVVAEASSQRQKEALENEGVIKMTSARLPRDLILLAVQTWPRNFDVTAEAIVRLSQAKVHQEVVKSMILSPTGKGGAPAETTARGASAPSGSSSSTTSARGRGK